MIDAFVSVYYHDPSRATVMPRGSRLRLADCNPFLQTGLSLFKPVSVNTQLNEVLDPDRLILGCNMRASWASWVSSEPIVALPHLLYQVKPPSWVLKKSPLESGIFLALTSGSSQINPLVHVV